MLLCYSSPLARTWYVKPDGTGDVPTIQAAVDSAAAQGDTVLLANGTFMGEGNYEVDCFDKAPAIISESGNPELCIIDCGTPPACNAALVGIYFRESVHGSPRLEGVTVRDGCGGVVCKAGSAPVISNCIFRDNLCRGCEIGYQGAGMRCFADSRPTIINCLFVDNAADGGGGLCTKGSSPTLNGVTFLNNGASGGGGMLAEGGGFARLTDCTFSGNRVGSLFGSRNSGGGLCIRASAELVNCTFVDNVSYDEPGGGLCFKPHDGSEHLSLAGCTFVNNRVDPWEWWEGGGGGMATWSWGEIANVSITGCTFAGNAVYKSFHGGGGLAFLGDANVVMQNTLIAFNDSGGAVYCSGANNLTLICCDVYGNVGGDWTGCIAGLAGINNNFSADPRFCDTLSRDFRVEDCSPCLPGNHPNGHECGGIVGAHGSGCACGALVAPTTWGGIKAMYR
jgi:hypothetical protein